MGPGPHFGALRARSLRACKDFSAGQALAQPHSSWHSVAPHAPPLLGKALVTKICTPTYVAKEILTRKMEPYTEKARAPKSPACVACVDMRERCLQVDVWSLGVVFYILFSGHPPFSGDTDFDVLKQAGRRARPLQR